MNLYFTGFWDLQNDQPATVEQARAFAQENGLEFEEDDAENGCHIMALKPEWIRTLNRQGDLDLETEDHALLITVDNP